MVVINVRARGSKRLLSITLPRTVAELVLKIRRSFALDDDETIGLYGPNGDVISLRYPLDQLQQKGACFSSGCYLVFIQGSHHHPSDSVADVIEFVVGETVPVSSGRAVLSATASSILSVGQDQPLAAIHVGGAVQDASRGERVGLVDEDDDNSDASVEEEDEEGVLQDFTEAMIESVSDTGDGRAWTSVSLHFFEIQPWLAATHRPRRAELTALATALKVN